MTHPFPENAIDGQVVTISHPDGSTTIATYSQAGNTWTTRSIRPPEHRIDTSPPITVVPTADGQAIVWDAKLQNWIAAKVLMQLQRLSDIDQHSSPSLGETPLWSYAQGAENFAMFRWGTPNAHIKPWDDIRNWESGAACYHQGRLWRCIHNNADIEPTLEDGKLSLYLHVKGEPTFSIVPMGLSAAAPPSGEIEATITTSHYAYHVEYINDSTATIWKFIVGGKSPVTHRPIGRWEARPWQVLVWRNLFPPPAAPPGFAYLWIYGAPGHTAAPILGQQTWAPLELGHNLSAGADVDCPHPQDGDLLTYQASSRKWRAIRRADLHAALQALGTAPPAPGDPLAPPAPDAASHSPNP